jgi:hypothetical protein
MLNSYSRWLKEHKKLNIYVEPRVMGELLSESSYFNFLHTWKDGELLNVFHFLFYMDTGALLTKKIKRQTSDYDYCKKHSWLLTANASHFEQ